ncbi:MAG: ferritin-like domain-containing protein, partial [Candidatus Halalkalibacterium sp. M3_1C_030]
IHKIYKLAREENDYPLESLLLWFIDEQVEEEEMVQDVIDKLKLVGEGGSGLYLLDREMGERQGQNGKEAEQSEDQ